MKNAEADVTLNLGIRLDDRVLPGRLGVVCVSLAEDKSKTRTL